MFGCHFPDLIVCILYQLHDLYHHNLLSISSNILFVHSTHGLVIATTSFSLPPHLIFFSQSLHLSSSISSFCSPLRTNSLHLLSSLPSICARLTVSKASHTFYTLHSLFFSFSLHPFFPLTYTASFFVYSSTFTLRLFNPFKVALRLGTLFIVYITCCITAIARKQ